MRVGCNRVSVIPGREANPESRDSGFDALHRPGMTDRRVTICSPRHPMAELRPSKNQGRRSKAAREEPCRFHSQRRASSDHLRASTCHGCCGCAARPAATIRS
ncbi:hypothetical protein FFI89_034105 [Bradyrhizobium sp. KBS0727]|nr:hypothetical protein FFI71_034110 [Bradyrhizobium sp. KBS0725]QDW48320.1 hypothetical protein FFI89_034105 [Bradyrhizobium sp. KBS0727]